MPCFNIECLRGGKCKCVRQLPAWIIAIVLLLALKFL